MRSITKFSLIVLALLSSIFFYSAQQAGATLVPSLSIHHQTKGCHSWALNGGAYQTNQTITIRHGGFIFITNQDVMPHKIVKLSGPAVIYSRVSLGTSLGLKGHFLPQMLARMGSEAKIGFTHPGSYLFTTHAGEDYFPGVKTTGNDNILHLLVKVT
jgi:hypothetical protein